MAARKRNKKKTTKKRATRKRATAKPTAAPPPAADLHVVDVSAPPPPVATGDQVLDLTLEPDRPLVRLPGGDFRLRIPEELTFEEFALQMSAGKMMIDRAGEIGEDGVLAELQASIVTSAKAILVDLTDEAAAGITPGQFQRISLFFNGLAGGEGPPASESGSSSAHGASDSSGSSATD